MVLLNSLDFTLPLSNPVIIFSLVLFIILFAPILLNKIKVPHIIGLIIAGVVIGPYGLNLLKRDSSIVLFGTVGLLYIMFLAGLELDLAEFKKNAKKILVFGLMSFILPFAFGVASGYYILGYGLMSSVLIGSMMSTHTLVSYPIASKYGIAQNRAVLLSVGGTMIADILALAVLVIVTGSTREEVTQVFWIQLGISVAVFVCIVFFLFPVIIRWFFKKFDDSVSQYVFVLAMVFLAAFLAEAAGTEAIIGALFAGLVLNKFIPHRSLLMNRINFVGNALFIPFFLISVGMLVDVGVLIKGWGALKVAAVVISLALLGKYLAAFFARKVFRLSADEGNILFGLSSSRAAATLAIVLIGYNIVIGETATGEPIRLLDEDILNGTILLILVSCAVSSFIVERAASKIAIKQETDDVDATSNSHKEKILISLGHADLVTPLLDFALMLRPKKSDGDLYALQIIDDENGKGSLAGRKLVDRAVIHASSTENNVIPLTRFDSNISNGIVYTIREHNITDVVIGVHQGDDQNNILGNIGESIIKRTLETIYIYKPTQPFNTFKRILVAMPPYAETEPGFVYWYGKLTSLAKEAGMPISFFGHDDTLRALQEMDAQNPSHVQLSFNGFNRWDDFLIFSRELKQNDLFIIISSRKGHNSYIPQLDKLSHYLNSYFKEQSFIILYPEQLSTGIDMSNIEQNDGSLIETITDRIGGAGRIFKSVFKDKNSDS